jgi:CheY-like chemotaxis protein
VAHADFVQVEVEDTGIGIPAEKLPGLFQSFEQVDASIQKRFGGTGLGLAITKRLCGLLGIDLTVESKPGAGSKFTLRIPRTYGSASFRLTRSPEEPAFGLLGEDGALLKSSSRSALVLVGASAELAASLASHLTGLPLEVRRFSDPSEALGLGDRLVWAIVIEPACVPLEALPELRRELGPVPAILVGSAAPGDPSVLGPLGHLAKPLAPDEILDALASRVAPRKEVLIVDDDPGFRELATMVLSEQGTTVAAVSSGAEALRRLENTSSVGAVVLDLLMPEMDGFAVLEAMRRVPEASRLPVVVVTAKDLTPREREILGQGTRRLLSKPVDPQAIARAIEVMVPAVEKGRADSVLVVDDNPQNRDVLGAIFEAAGYTVFSADSGPAAIELAGKHRPPVVLMDLAMPGMDGFEATRRLRRDLVTANATIIACSAFSSREFLDRASQAGCDGYILKPIDPERVVRQVKETVLAARVRASFEPAGMLR